MESSCDIDQTAVRPQHLLRVIAPALLVFFFLQCVFSMRVMTATFDESSHLPAGYMYWKTGDLSLNPEHPPLIKLLCALPLLVINPAVDYNDPSLHGEGMHQFAFGSRFLHSNDPDQLLFWGRLPVVLLGMLLGFYVWKWSKDLFGVKAALLALFFYVTCPTILAHTRVVTTDMGLALFSTATLYHWWRFLRDPKAKRHLWLTGLMLGLALGSKYLAILLFPMLVLTGILFCLFSPGGERPNKEASVALLGQALLIFLLGGVIVWIIFFMPLDPLFYLEGMNKVRATRTALNYPFYLLGEFSYTGWIHYFIVAFFLKTQVPFLIALAVTALFIRRLKMNWVVECFFILPMLIYVAVVSLRAANFGVRYLLPIYPLLFIFVSRLANVIPTRRAFIAIAGVLSLWQIASLLHAYPNYIGYFNEAAGGSKNGINLLDDSNLDWGQDIKLLKRYLDEHGIQQVKLEYNGTTMPARYGLNFVPMTESDWIKPSPGVVYAVQANVLVRALLYARESGKPMDWLERYRPIGRIHTGFFIYKFPESAQGA